MTDRIKEIWEQFKTGLKYALGNVKDWVVTIWNLIFLKPAKRLRIKKFMKNKLVWIGGIFALAFFVLLGNVIRLISTNADKYASAVLNQYRYSTSTIQAKRGTILDRNGLELATSQPNYILVLDNLVITADKEEKEVEIDGQKTKKTVEDMTISALVACFGLNEDQLREEIEANSTSSYYHYTEDETASKTYVTQEQMEAFEAMEAEDNSHISGVWFETEYQRYYPHSDLACRVIGFATDDGEDGIWGLESYYDSYLDGTDGRVTSTIDDDYNLVRTTYDAEDGDSIVTTLDVGAQSIIEADIQAYMDEIGGENVGVILMDPDNGEILGMATANGYDLNDPRTLTDYWSVDNQYTEDEITEMESEGMTEEEIEKEALNQMWRNFCISDGYEPGSTAKTFTIAAGIDENLIDPDDEYYCQGFIYSGNTRIRCHVREGHGELTVAQALEESCNDVLVQLSRIIGVDVFTQYQTNFNIGQLTGIDLPGEASCAALHYTADNMGDLELATNSFGQNFDVTMIQMAAAYASVINGGYYYQPHLMKEIRNEAGAVVEEHEDVILRQTISNETSATMRELLLGVVENGTGGLVNLEGYSIGGKTGAGEKLPRSSGNYIISFMSFTPVEDPEYLLYVIIDTPNVEDQSSSAQAQYLAREIWTDLLPYLNIYPDSAYTGLPVDDPDNPYVSDAYEAGIIEDDVSDEEKAAEESAAAESQAAEADGNADTDAEADADASGESDAVPAEVTDESAAEAAQVEESAAPVEESAAPAEEPVADDANAEAAEEVE